MSSTKLPMMGIHSIAEKIKPESEQLLLHMPIRANIQIITNWGALPNMADGNTDS